MLRIALYSVLYLMSYQILRKKSTVYFFPKSFVLLKTQSLWPVGVAGIGKSFRRSVATDGSFKWNYPAEGVAKDRLRAVARGRLPTQKYELTPEIALAISG